MISVCVPYWDRQEALDAMFANYAETYPDTDLEFSVCDDGSPTPAVVPEGVTLTRLPAKDHPLNPCVPINRAVEASSGDLVVLTNPEVYHPTPVLHEMLGLWSGEDDYVAARCYDPRWGRWLAHPDVNFREHGRLPVPDGAQFHFCALLHRSLWDRAGGFDADYRHGLACDDNDFLWRLHEAGATFRTTVEAVTHDSTTRLDWKLPHNRDLFASKWPNVL